MSELITYIVLGLTLLVILIINHFMRKWFGYTRKDKELEEFLKPRPTRLNSWDK